MISARDLQIIRQYITHLMRCGFTRYQAERIAVIAVRYSLTPEEFA